MNTPQQLEPRIPLTSHIRQIPKSATLAINEKSKQLIQEGRDVVCLGLGQSPFPVPDIMVKSLKSYARTKDYMAVQGYLPLREAIATYINHSEGLHRDAGDVIIGPGSKELFFDLQMVLDCDLVLPAPSWVSYDPQARLLGKKVYWLPCSERHGWKLTPAELEKHCQQHASRQQLLILNSPNNPTGACFTHQELKELAQVARRHGLIILSDEIYSELHYQGNHISIARYYPEGTIISNGISKWAGAGGWRLGFFIFPKDLNPVLQSMVTVASETFTSVSAPIQMASLCAFEDSTSIISYIHACRQIMQVTGTNFSRLLNNNLIRTVEPDGGFYALADFSHFREPLLAQGITNAQSLCREMLDAAGVAALPGDDFGMREGLYVRFAFVDFDGTSLLQRTLQNPTFQPDSDTPELGRIFTAAEKINDWLNGITSNEKKLESGT